ncbi:MAG: dihydroorotate dehydrogenase electron transfer subunit [Blastocatellia bacterium AA13]|nr:MAG: dihydroorotate dehydrogenase electron transfer subunit [Blastocatellia bacterium AA13]
MIEIIATVQENVETSAGYRKLTLHLASNIAVQPGQFAMLRPHDAYEPVLRRALAIYQIQDERTISFLYQVLGRGTQALARLRSGDRVDALLPLGNCWPIEPVESGGHAVVVSGGIGSASVLLLCEELMKKNIRTTVVFGAATEAAAVGCGLNDFRQANPRLITTTDDGSLGERGLVTAPLKRLLMEEAGSRPVIYACGPWAMMKAVAGIARDQDTACVVSLEAPMGCGFGVCVGCVVAVNQLEPGEYGTYKRVCVDGPVFPSEAIRWDVAGMIH